MPPRRLALALVLLIAGALGACGRRGDLEPPPGSVADAPAPVSSAAPAPGSGGANSPADSPPVTQNSAAPNPLPRTTVVGKPVGSDGKAKPSRSFPLDKVL